MGPLIPIAVGVAALLFLGSRDKSAQPFVGPPSPNGDPLRALADAIDADIRKNGANYDRALVRRFQTEAGILVDGLYGPETATHLAMHTGREPPAPIFQPAPPEQPSHDPLTGTETDRAKQLAEQVEADVRQKASQYDRELVKAFQRLARPLVADGKYGPQTAGAVEFYTGRTPPAPIYAGANGNRTPVKYTPPK